MKSRVKERERSDSENVDIASHDVDEYEVEKIIDMTEEKEGGVTTRTFLVVWVGYDETTWEPEGNLPENMVTAFVDALRTTEIADESSNCSRPCAEAGVVADIESASVALATVAVEEPMLPVVAPTTHAAVPASKTQGVPVDVSSSVTADNTIDQTRKENRTRQVASAQVPVEGHHRSGRLDVAKDVPDSIDADEYARDEGVANAGVATDVRVRGDGDEYEIERILQMTTETKNKIDIRKFLVSWVGYDEQTWEPEENLPASMVSAYDCALPSVSKTSADTRSDEESRCGAKSGAVCATCGDGPGGLGSSCVRCRKPMHHFCATEVCVSLGLRDANGETVDEFPNDTCYCSKTCFNLRPGAIRASKRKRIRTAKAPSESDFEDDEDDEEEDEDDDDEASYKDPKRLKKRAPTKPKSLKAPAKPRARNVPLKPKKSLIAVEAPPDVWPPRKSNKTVTKAKPTVAVNARDPLIGRMVAFCADKELWMSSKIYKEAKGLYLSGRIHKPTLRKGERPTEEGLYEVRWTVTNYQKKKFFHRIPRKKVEEGIQNHTTLSGGSLNNATWRHICQVPDSEAMQDGENLDNYVILDGTSDVFVSEQMLPANLQLVDTTRFSTNVVELLRVSPAVVLEYVVKETNEYADHQKGKAVTLDELMRFFGIMFYMTIVDKGEYSNHWGSQVENEIFSVESSGFGLDKLMTLKRFQYIRKNLCFRYNVSSQELKKDPAARIRPLLNMIKHTSSKYVVLGRNVAVDESSIACRSKFGRHLIVYNSSKPTGKFHFKIYACCCATSWLMVGFRLHCASDMEDRLKGVIPAGDARYLDDRLQFSSSVRRIVLEVTQPIHNTRRVVNTDNFYTSVTLLMSLRDVGLYGRGTIRENSAHFPKAHMFAKKADEPRGSSLQGVSNTGQMIAASWMDGSAVNIISNADSSDMGEVTRLIGKEHLVFPAPKCVSEYNKHMQGVDRLDQLRAQYSLADGHSMQNWHKKLALAFIDIARVNAYVTKCLRNDSDDKPVRNQHRQFMIELASELITGKWKESSEDEGMLFADEQLSTASLSIAGSPSVASPIPTVTCDFVLSKVKFPKATRGKRGCKICLFEGRRETMKSLYCTRHNICVCTGTYSLNTTLEAVVCPHASWTCWRKYHDYYLPRGVFNENGNIMRSSKIFQARRQLRLDDESQAAFAQPAASRGLSPEVDVYMAPESPPTLVFSPFDGARANAQQTEASSPSHNASFEEYRSPREITSAVSSSADYQGSYTIVL